MASKPALVVKNLPANAGDVRDTGWIPGSGRFPGEGNGNPLQYSNLENPMDRGAWQATVPGVTKSRPRLKQVSMHALTKVLKHSQIEFLQLQNEIIYLTSVYVVISQVKRIGTASGTCQMQNKGSIRPQNKPLNVYNPRFLQNPLINPSLECIRESVVNPHYHRNKESKELTVNMNAA